MQTTKHLTYFKKAKIRCACGAAYEVGSTSEEILVELCAACHPFYTGESKKMLDTARRVEKFVERMGKKDDAGTTGKKVKRGKRAALKTKKESEKEAVKTAAKTKTPAKAAETEA
ncbi:50S ribosomal protein L31 [Candidatus Uhrbacteria bacterium]|nr:50S ribosomal protein L31 [Candidatus Uhrbacteria bacterium]